MMKITKDPRRLITAEDFFHLLLTKNHFNSLMRKDLEWFPEEITRNKGEPIERRGCAGD